MNRRLLAIVPALVASVLGGGCGKDSGTGGSSGQGGTPGAGGSAESGGASTGRGGASAGGGGTSAGGGGAGGQHAGGKSDLPVPPTHDVSKPSGEVGGLTVLDWAGFKSAVTFTFDDSLQSQIDNYPALNATGVHLTFYLISAASTAKDPAWSQMRTDGHELGNHTEHHCRADGTSCGSFDGSPGAELDACNAYIEQSGGQDDVWTAASPYGDTGYDDADKPRFLINRGVPGGTIGAGLTDMTDPYNLPCHTAAMGETETTPSGGFDKATDDSHAAGRWQIFLVHSMGGDGGYNPVKASDVTGAIEHAKAFEDVWLDSVVHVGSYWIGQKLLQKAQPTGTTKQTWTWTLPDHYPPGRYLRVTVTGGTLSQGDVTLAWDDHGYYEVALDAGTLTLAP